MALTVQQMYDYLNGITEEKAALIIKGKSEGEDIFFKIYLAHDKYYLDAVKAVESNDIVHREVLDKEEKESFKVMIMDLMKEIDVEDIYID